MAKFKSLWNALTHKPDDEKKEPPPPPAQEPPSEKSARPAPKRGDFLDDSGAHARALKDHASGNAPNDLQAMQVLDDAHTAPDLESNWLHVLDEM